MFKKKVGYMNNQKDYKEKYYTVLSMFEDLRKVNVQMGENFQVCRKEKDVLKKENDRLTRNNKYLEDYVDRLLNIIDNTNIGKVIDENNELKANIKAIEDLSTASLLDIMETITIELQDRQSKTNPYNDGFEVISVDL